MRSDSQLQLEIRNEVARQLGDRADDTGVQVLQGVVTLTGQLRSDLEKWNLRDAITAMAGVENLVDETMIVPGPAPRSPDADAARPWFPAD